MKKGRLHFLDSMRGIAALQVVCSHYYGAYSFPGELPGGAIHFWRDGFAAVSFFFVLSGFVLSKSSFEGRGVRVRSFSDWCRYTIDRVFRIHPAFWFAMLLTFVLHSIVNTPSITSPVPTEWIKRYWSASPSVWELIINSTLMSYRENMLVPQAWTLTIEFLLSLLLPAAILLAAHSLPMFLACTVLLLFRLELQQFFFHFSLGIFLAGCWRFPIVGMALASRGWRLALLIIGGYFYTIRYGGAANLADTWAWHLTGVGAFCLLLAVLYDTSAQRILLWRPLQVLGRISYSVYLLHFSVLLYVTPHALFWMNGMGLADGWLPWSLGFIVTILVTVLVSWFSRRFIEEPAHRLGKTIASHYLSAFNQKKVLLVKKQ